MKKVCIVLMVLCLAVLGGCGENIPKDEMKYRFLDSVSLKLTASKNEVLEERDLESYGDLDFYIAKDKKDINGTPFDLSVSFKDDEVEHLYYGYESNDFNTDSKEIERYLYDIYGEPEEIKDDENITWSISVDSRHIYAIVLYSSKDNNKIYITVTKRDKKETEQTEIKSLLDDLDAYEEKYGKEAADKMREFDRQSQEIEEQKESIQQEIDRISK